jgi:hypothetical protein
MTPLITKAVTFFPDLAADYQWFDISDLDIGRETVHEENMHWIRQPLPFSKCAIAGIDLDGQTYALLISREDEMLLVNGANTIAAFDNLRVQKDAAFRVNPLEEFVDDGITVHFEDKRIYGHEPSLEHSRGNAVISIVMIATFLRNLHGDKISTAYTPIPRKNHAKRLRQKKLPMFDWHTVVIEPRKQKNESLGGTHASPRLHEVRGHWVMRNNKRFWRKPHKRGDASKGVVFHDYKLKGERSESISQ